MLSNTVKDKLGHSDLVSSLADDITDEEDEGSSMSQAVGRQAKQVRQAPRVFVDSVSSSKYHV